MTTFARLPITIPYDPDFLGNGLRVPLPKLGARAKRDAWERGRVLDYIHYSLVMNQTRRLATFTAVNVDGEHRVHVTRKKTPWVEDPRIPREYQTLQSEGYAGSAFDKGHLVRREDVLHGDRNIALVANDATFVFTNAAPQHMNFNQDEWLELEDWVLDRATELSPRLAVFSGPVFGEDDPAFSSLDAKTMTRVAQDYVIPVAFWKVVVLATEGVSGPGLSAAAFVVSQDDKWGEHNGKKFRWLREYQVRVQDVEQLTNLDFGAHVRRASRLDEEALDRAGFDPIDVSDREKIVLPARGVSVSSAPYDSGASKGSADRPFGCGCQRPEGGTNAVLEARVDKLEQDLQTLLAIVATRLGGSRSAPAAGEQGPEATPGGTAGARSGEFFDESDAPPAQRSAAQEEILTRASGEARERLTAILDFQSPDPKRADPAVVVDRIMGGTEVAADDFPDCAVIRYDAPTLCTGVLVAPQIVLTAAHCRAYLPRSVRLATASLGDGRGSEYPVLRALRHEDYGRGTVADGDIMVLFLSKPAKEPPVKVATAAQIAALRQGEAVGFGSDNALGRGGAGRKRKARLPLGPVSAGAPTEFEALLGARLGYNPKREFLAGMKGSGVDSCKGDSGGPLYVTIEGRRYLAGLTSRAAPWQGGRPCGDGGIYTLVDAYREWIKQLAKQAGIGADL